jgi:3-phenylpropionate/cinnamic acid dioxygenase small subunit
MAKPSVEDRLAIEDLLVRYTTALDEGDVEGLVGCFTEDGWLDSPIIGRHEGEAALRAFATDIAGRRRRGAQFRHVVSNFRIDVSGDRGRARCYLLDLATVAGVTTLLSPGEYDCELRKVGGEWLFSSRLVMMDKPFAIP